MEHYTISPTAGEDDLRAWSACWNDLRPEFAQTFEEFAHDLQWAPAEHTAHLVARSEVGEVVGIANAQEQAYTPGSSRFRADVLVRPDAQGHGIGQRLYEQVSAFTREHGGSGLVIPAFASDARGLPFWKRRGYEEVERYIDVALELEGLVLPEAPLPDGVRIVTLADHPELAGGHRDVVGACLSDIPQAEQPVVPEFDEWQRLVLGAPSFDPASCFIAAVKDEVGGLRAVGVAELEFQRAIPDQAWHGFTAVLREWRRRGLARALKFATIRHAQAIGLRRLLTENEERNAPMRSINIELGYRPTPVRVLLHGPLAGGPGVDA